MGARQGVIRHRHRNDGLYECTETYTYKSPRYGKCITVQEGQVRDGASGAIDIESDSWWVHDEMCARGTWDDGSKVTRAEAAAVLGDILASEGRWFRRITWPVATFTFGCRRVRKSRRF